MQELIDRVARATGLDAGRAENAIAITLSLIRSQGDRGSVDALFAKLPGAENLAARHGKGAGRDGGIFGALVGGLGGGPLAAVAKLKAAGLTLDQIKTLGSEILTYAKEKAGAEIVRDVAASIPGLSGYARM